VKVSKPTLARGMRDFTPKQFAQRDYIIDTIASIYKKYGFEKAIRWQI
jgi:histidyl-tRNA synthetase